jgi:hypothetical protein
MSMTDAVFGVDKLFALTAMVSLPNMIHTDPKHDFELANLAS